MRIADNKYGELGRWQHTLMQGPWRSNHMYTSLICNVNVGIILVCFTLAYRGVARIQPYIHPGGALLLLCLCTVNGSMWIWCRRIQADLQKAETLETMRHIVRSSYRVYRMYYIALLMVFLLLNAAILVRDFDYLPAGMR